MNENPLRVLLVDDERSLREPLAKYLGQRFGYSVETAATAAEALACVEQAQGKYDVILLDDMLMPDQDREPERLGIKLMSQIRSAYPDAVFILFTAWGRESGLEALRAGAYRYLRKPFDNEELALMIEHAAEYQRLKGIARDKQMLERLMETSAALLGDRSLPDVLDTILRGVQAIGFDRARLYLRDDDENTMIGRAQVGMEANFEGFRLSIANDRYVQKLLADPRPHVFERSADQPLPYQMELAKETVNAWACAPLMLGGKVIGKLSADNKYSDRPIEEAQLQAVALFAAQAAAAIENARLMEDVSEQKDRLARLITSSPSGVISIDRNSVVTEFNAQAAAILGYQPEEVLDKRVDFLYCDPQEPRKIGRKLHEAADGKVQGYQTDVRSKAGERIPIRLAATWLYDAHGRRVGSVGYFEDLRAIDEKKKRIEFLLKASNIVARAECLTEGLDSLAEMLVTHLATTFCRILILDEQQQNLIVEAAYPHPRATGELNWQPGRGEPIALDDWPGLAPLIWEGGPTPISAEEERDRPLLRKLSRYLGLEKPIQSLLVIPLRSQTHVIGLLSLGELRSSARQSFKQEKINLAEAIAEQSAILIDRVRLLEATERSKTRLTSLYEASNQLVSSQDPERVLSDILDLVRSTAEASWVSAVLIDEIGQARQLTTSGTDKQFDVGNIIRPDGFSMQVMRTGRHVAIENCDDLRDRVNPSVFRNGVKAALCLPLSLRGRQMGVMWVHYNRPRRFPESDVEALQLYVNQAAIAYDSARRIAELERMRQAAEALAGATTIQDVLRRVVRQAQETLHADTTAFWAYESSQERFILRESVACDIPDDLWDEFRKEEPRKGGTAYSVMEQRWIGVTDVADAGQYPFLGKTTRGFLQRIKTQSFQGVALDVGDEILGVLYVNYGLPRSFSKEDQRTARTFANHAALALKKAKVLEQVSKARNTAEVVSKVTLLGDCRTSLQSVAEGTQDVLGCDAVAVYAYDQTKNRFNYPPIMLGVKHPDKASRLPAVPSESVVTHMLKKEDLYIAENAPAHHLFKDRRFTVEERIISLVAIPLKVGAETVGVMFVNYRTQHRFTDDDLTNIRLYANQAAVAIRNAQLYDRLQKRASALHALYEAGRAVTRSLNLDKILSQIAEQACRLTGDEGQQADFSNIRLVEDGKSRLVAAYPAQEYDVIRNVLGDTVSLDARQNGGRVGIMGRVALTGEPQLVADVREDSDYLESHPNTRSELAVPICIGAEVIGVINVEHSNVNAFDREDQQVLELLAAQAAVAINNARQYETLCRHSEHQQAVYAGSKVISEGITLGQKQLLDRILEQAVERIRPSKGSKAILGVIQLCDKANNELYFESTYPQEVLPTLTSKFGDRRPLDKSKGKIGITGRTVLERSPQRVPDVQADPDYLVFHPDTRSELNVPLLEGDTVLGVLSLESDLLAAFDEEDEASLQSLAELAVIAIQNARQYDELRRTKGLVARQMTVAWMGMVSSTWQHGNMGKAITIKEEIDALRTGLPETVLNRRVRKRLDKIKRLANQILTKPMIAPLSTEERGESVSVSSLLDERLNQLWENEPYSGVQLKREIGLMDDTTVRADPQWLRRAFDIIIDNAVDAIRHAPTRRITVTTRQHNRQIEIRFSDTGPGIPEHVQAKLFRERIRHPKGEGGLGMGLLMAQTIVQAFGGDIGIEKTDATGTTMFVRLPIEDDWGQAR